MVLAGGWDGTGRAAGATGRRGGVFLRAGRSGERFVTRWIIANFVAVGALTCTAFAADAPPAQKQESAQQSPSRVDKQGRPDGQQRPRREWWRENGGKPPAM